MEAEVGIVERSLGLVPQRSMFTGLAALTELLRRKPGTDDALAVLLALPTVTSGFPNFLLSRQIVAARTNFAQGQRIASRCHNEIQTRPGQAGCGSCSRWMGQRAVLRLLGSTHICRARRNPRTSPSRTSFSPLSSPLGGQALDERRELPVRVIPDNDAAILELLLKLLVQVGGKGVH